MSCRLSAISDWPISPRPSCPVDSRLKLTIDMLFISFSKDVLNEALYPSIVDSRLSDVVASLCNFYSLTIGDSTDPVNGASSVGAFDDDIWGSISCDSSKTLTSRDLSGDSIFWSAVAV